MQNLLVLQSPGSDRVFKEAPEECFSDTCRRMLSGNRLRSPFIWITFDEGQARISPFR